MRNFVVSLQCWAYKAVLLYLVKFSSVSQKLSFQSGQQNAKTWQFSVNGPPLWKVLATSNRGSFDALEGSPGPLTTSCLALELLIKAEMVVKDGVRLEMG